MINLLPPKEKEKILWENKKKLVTIFWFLVLFFIVFSIIILFLIRTYLGFQIELQKNLLAGIERETEQSEAQNIQKEVQSFNSALLDLSRFYKSKFSFTEIIEKISRILPEGMYLNNLSVSEFSDEKESGLTISLIGFSPTREALFEFKKNLEKESEFKDVNLPSSNWVKPNDINFSATLKILKQK